MFPGSAIAEVTTGLSQIWYRGAEEALACEDLGIAQTFAKALHQACFGVHLCFYFGLPHVFAFSTHL